MLNNVNNVMVNWGDNAGNSAGLPAGDYWNVPQIEDYYYHYWIPTYYPIVQIEKSKIDIAFRILKSLQDKKVINVVKVQTFIELVDAISKEL